MPPRRTKPAYTWRMLLCEQQAGLLVQSYTVHSLTVTCSKFTANHIGRSRPHIFQKSWSAIPQNNLFLDWLDLFTFLTRWVSEPRESKSIVKIAPPNYIFSHSRYEANQIGLVFATKSDRSYKKPKKLILTLRWQLKWEGTVQSIFDS